MSRPAPLETAELGLDDPFGTSAAVRRRRLDAARARRRRLLLADLAAGTALGVLGLLVAPGLAIAALGALLLLAACGVAAVVRRARAQLRPRRSDRGGADGAWRAP